LFITGDRLTFFNTFYFLIPVPFSLVVSLIFPSLLFLFFCGMGGRGVGGGIGNLLECVGIIIFVENLGTVF
jgi:hypothetical protein